MTPSISSVMEEEECILFHRPHQLLVPSEVGCLHLLRIYNSGSNHSFFELWSVISFEIPHRTYCFGVHCWYAPFLLSITDTSGTQRGGKSTLLNLMHSRQTAGFGLGHYMDAQTTGFWVWVWRNRYMLLNYVKARRHPRNKDLTILLMDTEGLDTPHSMSLTNQFNSISSSILQLDPCCSCLVVQ